MGKKKFFSISSNLILTVVIFLLFSISIGMFYDIFYTSTLKIYGDRGNRIAIRIERVLYKNFARAEEFTNILQEVKDPALAIKVLEKSLANKINPQVAVTFFNENTGVMFESYQQQWGCNREKRILSESDTLRNTLKFKLGLNNRLPTITKPYKYSYSFDYDVEVISTIFPIFNSEGEYLGFLSLDTPASTVNDIVTQSFPLDEGYIYVIDSNSDIIFHPKSDLVGRSSVDLVKKASNKKVIEVTTRISQPFFLRERSPYTDKFSLYFGIPVMNGLHSADNWTVVLVVPMLKFFEDFLKISILFSLLAILTYFLVSMNNNDKKI